MAGKTFKYVVLGGGMVAGYAAKEFVERGLKPGELGIVSSDNVLPYERPPLSKGFLAGRDTDESILINPEAFYRDHGIEMRLQAVVEGVDFAQRRLRTRGDEYGYEKLLIATGARVRTLAAVAGAATEGIHYLRSRDDAARIRAEAQPGRRAIVIGGGFIGMEVASVLAQKGMETIMLVAESRIWERLFTPELSGFFQRYYQARGVKMVFRTDLGTFWGGNERLPADVVVAGIGVLPATELFEGAGLELRNGIVVNEYLETNVSNVYAAGDVARYRDLLFGGDRRVEHWDNAVKQGQHAARVMLGAREPFENVPYFFSDVFDLSWEFWGDTAGADRAVTRGEFDSKSFSVWWLKQGRLTGAFVMNRPDEEREAAQRWIREKRQVPPERLADSSAALR